MLENIKNRRFLRSQKSKDFREDHFCEFEVAEDLVFCVICGKAANIAA